ncbi:hypothetical protein PPYR_14581 [Photinus pyralis]|uniref:Peptidase S1 domain-containing protein n=2 Tax=Photinus pyralis TaxID=7054 RepID=A0A5N4A5P6_PHOPY|nr:chymotrypsin-1-like [Photinus pyralis]KAB0792622.1 hypothetical protein PPYR_14581 [Photinus pyralis]
MTVQTIAVAIALLGQLSGVSSERHLSWRVIGGQDAEDGLYPYQVSVRHQGYASRKVNETHCRDDFSADYHFGFHTCGGSIISSEYVLTAAHCVSYEKPVTFLVVVGTNTLNSGGEAYAVTEIHWHEDFSMWHGQNDVAVLKVSPPIEFADNIRPVRVDEDIEVEVLDEVTLSGWGTTDRTSMTPNKLQHIKLRLLDVDYCDSQHQLAVTDSQLCTSTFHGKGACKGDSGGPLVKVHSNNGTRQIGIVSFSRNCAAGYPDVYARVASYIPWIKEKCNNCI